jgi:hypothetical protein
MKRQTIMIIGAAGGIRRAKMQLFTEDCWQVTGVDQLDFEDGFL